MGFNRNNAPEILTGDTLFASLAGLGFHFAIKPISNVNIEDALISAAVAATEGIEDRLWPMLLDWWSIHHAVVNADSLCRALTALNNSKVSVLFAGLAQATKPIGRFRKLAKFAKGQRLTYISEHYLTLARESGEHPRYAASSLVVPVGLYEPSVKSISKPEQVATRHRGYYWRVLMGPLYRADIWTSCELTGHASIVQIAKECRCTFNTAKTAIEDFRTLNARRHRAR